MAGVHIKFSGSSAKPPESQEPQPLNPFRNGLSEARRKAESAARIYSRDLLQVHDRTYAFTREYNLEGFAKDQSTPDQLDWIKRQLAEISNNHLIQYKESAAKARVEMENALRSDLLIKLWLRVSNANLQINRLNKMLGTKVFHREKYAFSSSQEPAYADILKVAKRVQDNDANVLALFADGVEADAEYAKGVERIRAMLEGGDDVSDIADYRNYLRFELNTTDLEGKKVSSYSQRQMSGSGGERQTPFYLAISCAMAQTCHHDEQDRSKLGLGLVMFDEAFNALDGGNVNSCLSLMANFNLQVIASAPTDKLPNFMEHMSTIITVNRVDTYCQVDVEYPTQLGREAFRAANPANISLDMFREMKAAEAQMALVDAAH